MRLIFVMILLLSNISSNAQCSTLSILRETYVSSQSDMKSCKELDNLTKNCIPKLASVEFSYNIISHLMECNFIFNPFVKYATFTESTQQLDSMIYLNPQYTEIRFLRYLVQLNCPRFLGYQTNNSYIKSIRMAHKVHHKTLGKYGSSSFGMLIVSKKYFKS